MRYNIWYQLDGWLVWGSRGVMLAPNKMFNRHPQILPFICSTGLLIWGIDILGPLKLQGPCATDISVPPIVSPCEGQSRGPRQVQILDTLACLLNCQKNLGLIYTVDGVSVPYRHMGHKINTVSLIVTSWTVQLHIYTLGQTLILKGSSGLENLFAYICINSQF